MLQKNQIIELVIDDIANDGSGVRPAADGLAVFVPQHCGRRPHLRQDCQGNAPARLRRRAGASVARPRTQQRCLLRMPCLPPLRKLLAAPSDLRRGAAHQGTLGKRKPPPDRRNRSARTPLPALSRVRPLSQQSDLPHPNAERGAGARVLCQTFPPVEPIGDCLLHPEVFSALCRAVLGWIRKHRISVYDEQAHAGLIRSLYLRQADATGEVMAA